MSVTDVSAAPTNRRSEPAPEHSAPEQTSPSQRKRDAEVADLFRRLNQLPDDDPGCAEIRGRIVEHYIGLARHIASRYANRGEPTEDLEQAALLGLVKAVNGFDTERGHDFIAYAVPMMTGEVKRHFRDKTWAVRVPRRHQEKRSELNRTIHSLTQRLGRSPRMGELAHEMEMSVDDLSELMEASTAYSALSLDSPANDDEGNGLNLGDTIGGLDGTLEGVVEREALPSLLRSLPERERRIVLLRFFGNKTQSEIAADIGISQMHVSRLLSNALARMRRGMLEDG
ncbi:RNA polymerase sigma factor SigF [Salinactinospora qingdaonensis]|uniref:RNA polymerase sigma-B factor n=1 Tax=Salinactinospora qingdaonensis TaxID=702744 RepID=A0ABP7F5J4_9ACTN